MATAKQHVWSADHDGLSPEAWAHVRAMEDARERDEARGADLAALGIYGWHAEWSTYWDDEYDGEEQQTPEAELGLAVMDASVVWPEWDGIEECRCGARLDEMAEVPGSHPNECPGCGLELTELVYEHCQCCGRTLTGRYVVDRVGDAFCDYDCALAGARELVQAPSGADLYVIG